MRFLRTLFVPAALLIGAQGVLYAQSDAETKRVDQQIVEFAQKNSEIMANLEYLCDMIGPRLTGSERLRQANEWTKKKMEEYGLENVHLESYTIPVGWERGKVEARILEPNGLPILAHSWAWCPGTKGKVKGPVVYVPATETDLEKYRGKLKNAIVMTTGPLTVPQLPSRAGTNSFWGSGVARGGTLETHHDDAAFDAAARQRETNRMEFFRKEGVAVLIQHSGKPQGLFTMSGSWGAVNSPANFPRLVVAGEYFNMLHRLLARNIPITMEVKIENRFVKGPVTVYNTVGEIRGTEKPDEVVICGAHLDSWDLATGTVDNGTGSMTVLETARLLKAMGLKPKRTIRFILFSGEEQGLHGSHAYVEKNKAQMGKISAVFVHDTGTGKVNGIGLHGNGQAQPVLEQEVAVLKDLGVTRYSTYMMGGTDHASFATEGVPAFWFMQDAADYFMMHHSQTDTFDKAQKDDLIQSATVMAICAYNVAQLPEMLPRKAK